MAEGLPVDLDGLRVRWSAAGDPEDIRVSLEEMDHQHRTPAKTVRSTEGQITFAPDEYREILNHRDHNGENRLGGHSNGRVHLFFARVCRARRYDDLGGPH